MQESCNHDPVEVRDVRLKDRNVERDGRSSGGRGAARGASLEFVEKPELLDGQAVLQDQAYICASPS
jgi:hypothetical protein